MFNICLNITESNIKKPKEVLPSTNQILNHNCTYLEFSMLSPVFLLTPPVASRLRTLSPASEKEKERWE